MLKQNKFGCMQYFVMFSLTCLVLSCSGSSIYIQEVPIIQRDESLFIIFDVGQADAMLVYHNGKTLLVDAGVSRDKWDAEKFTVIPSYLYKLTNTRRLDFLLVTHYHADHIGAKKTKGKKAKGLFALMDNHEITVDTLIDRGFFVFGREGYTLKQYRESISDWMKDGRVRKRVVAKLGDKIDLGPGIDVEVVAVNGNGRLTSIKAKNPRLFDEWTPSENDYSIALKFVIGNFEMFSGGDLSGLTVRTEYGGSKGIYNDIESLIAGLVGDIEVLRVNHHGSDHSSNPCFIQVLHPEVSIFSTGENRYFHPSIRVFDALSAIGDVYITGGVDSRVAVSSPHVLKKVVYGHVFIKVAPDGSRYWVNGKEYVSKSEEEERARPDFLDVCEPDIEDIRDYIGDDRDED